MHWFVCQQEQDGRTNVAALDASTATTLWPASSAPRLSTSMSARTMSLARRIDLFARAAFPTTSPKVLKIFKAMSTFVSHVFSSLT